jgi:hypothetical protein
MDHYEILKKLIDEQRKQDSKGILNFNQETTKSNRKPASFIYLDEKDNQIKEIPLSKLNLDSSASAYINYRTDYSCKNPLKLIHDSIFG